MLPQNKNPLQHFFKELKKKKLLRHYSKQYEQIFNIIVAIDKQFSIVVLVVIPWVANKKICPNLTT